MKDFCDNEEWLAAYLDRQLSSEERGAYEKHIAGCRRCLAALLAAKREFDDMAETLSVHPSLPHVAGHGSAQRIPRAARAARRPPLFVALAGFIRYGAARYTAVAVSIVMVIALSLVMLSPAWDPDLRNSRSEIRSVLSSARLGDMRLSGGPEGPARPAAIRGSIALDNRRLDRLEGTLNMLVRRYPRNPEAYRLLGHLHFALNRFDRAEVAYRRAAHLRPEDGRALNDLAVVSYRKGDTDSALKRLIDAEHRDSVPAEVYYNLAVLHHKAGELSLAIRYLETYLRMDPSSPWAAEARSLIQR